MNAFTIPAKSCLLDELGKKPTYPQLSYYHRAMANGTHPRKLRSLGLPVVDRRFKANKAKSHSARTE